MAYKIFLSHCETDKRWVQWIASNAENVDISVYMYEHDVQPGMPIATKVQAAIEDSQALVVLLSENSQYSPYVQQEIGFAKAKNKLIIPLVQPGVSSRSLAMLEGIEYIHFDLRNPQGALARLLDYLKKFKQSREKDQAILMGLGVLVLLGLLSTSGR